MDNQNIKVEIKKINENRRSIIVNVTFKGLVETRGWVVKPSKFPLEENSLFWWIVPPSTLSNGKYFRLVNVLDKDYYKKLEKLIARKVEQAKPFEKTNLEENAESGQDDEGYSNYREQERRQQTEGNDIDDDELPF